MIKNFIILSLLLILTNCGAPGTALLGPAVTGVTTKSVARSTISLGSNVIVKNLKNKSENKKTNVLLKLND